ncbi:betaine--homocysteine S-methyltransferase [Pelagibius litoralis]|uniref:Betaine--homocysteine S-methyltransferase n=1 Tax=Pelagibius litoralis TaxID=374515 RepID=A0A967EW07_9PROT|nr:betaine--homocysteine S-methyltransferase [Pelagibius litoralis]NIA68914.1 betaine--homocysteine S-methyltransferase [Pelagibius litoralis]
MADRLTELLKTRPWLLADGATGTNFFAMGLQHGDAPEIWNLERPDDVVRHYRSFIDAGSDIVLTNTFGGTANRMKLHRAEDKVFEINKAAAELARRAAKESGRDDVIVAGSIGPTGDLFEPLGPMTIETGAAAFEEQAKGLAAGGADVAWIETMSAVDEVKAAVQGATAAGLPYVVTLSFDTNGRTMMGITPAQFASLAHELTPGPLAFGGNCGTGASELMAALLNLKDAKAETDVLVAKSNCGIPQYVEGAIEYTGTPALMADYARLAVDAGVRIIGGCCGTSPEHIRAMRAALETHEKAAPPEMATVIAKLGEISKGAEQQQAGPLGEIPAAPARRRREGRRRGRAAG